MFSFSLNRMKLKKYTYPIVISLILIPLLSGCYILNNYGKVRAISWRVEKTTLSELLENWQDYTISYDGMYGGLPPLIMFDPKDDDKTMQNNMWPKVTDLETLKYLIGIIRIDHARLYKVFGPNDQFYGYMFYACCYPTIEVMDDKTLFVHDMSLISYDHFNKDNN